MAKPPRQRRKSAEVRNRRVSTMGVYHRRSQPPRQPPNARDPPRQPYPTRPRVVASPSGRAGSMTPPLIMGKRSPDRFALPSAALGSESAALGSESAALGSESAALGFCSAAFCRDAWVCGFAAMLGFAFCRDAWFGVLPRTPLSQTAAPTNQLPRPSSARNSALCLTVARSSQT